MGITLIVQLEKKLKKNTPNKLPTFQVKLQFAEHAAMSCTQSSANCKTCKFYMN